MYLLSITQMFTDSHSLSPTQVWVRAEIMLSGMKIFYFPTVLVLTLLPN